jgi:hypothetical protein
VLSGLPHARSHGWSRVAFCLGSWCDHGGIRRLREVVCPGLFRRVSPPGSPREHLEGPGIYLLSIGPDVLDDQGAERAPEIVGLPRADTQTVSPVGGVWGIEHQARQTGDGFMPSFRHNKRIGYREHRPQLRFGEAYVQAPQKDQELGCMVYNEFEQGDILS